MSEKKVWGRLFVVVGLVAKSLKKRGLVRTKEILSSDVWELGVYYIPKEGKVILGLSVTRREHLWWHR